LQLYPGDKDAAYAQYIIGMSYFKRMPHITRDQTMTEKSFNAMTAVVEKYPESGLEPRESKGSWLSGLFGKTG